VPKNKLSTILVIVAVLTLTVSGLYAASEVLIEAESFANKGGWKNDQQFVDIMGSPYLLAHGLGKPVENASTEVAFPETGTYRLWVRTKNWVPGEWEAPGRFKLVVDGSEIVTVFGTETGWGWQNGGTVEITSAKVKIELKDLTGFDGRCDAIYFTTDAKITPPNDLKEMRPWRNQLLGLPDVPPSAGEFDVVVVGGGIAGCAAALAAEKEGLKVALIHDRPLLGGNASSEVRVHAIGVYGKNEELLKGIDTGHWKNGSHQSKEDTVKRHNTMDTATGIEQFLSWRAYGANTKGSKIISVDARHIETGEQKRFTAPVFIDCTGDGWIGFWAGAKFSYGRESADTYGEWWSKHGDKWSPKVADNITMGTSVLWNSQQVKKTVSFPKVPWAMDVAKKRKEINGNWTWEYASNDKNQIYDAEEIRDHILRAIFGTFYNAKKISKNGKTELKWVAYIGGRRESRRLLGDYVFTQKDALSKFYFKDTVAEEKRDIDVHFQRKSYRSGALFHETHGTYYIPFRTLYSKNVDNLMMAGRCFSCSHIGLGGPRIMLTTGQMGIATGYAASLCKKYEVLPRGVYEKHIDELQKMIGYGDKK
jgi:hypothetical protein